MLDRLSVYLLLLRAEVCLGGRMVNTICFSSAAEDKRISCILGRCRHLWQACKFDCMFKKLKLKIRLTEFLFLWDLSLFK